MGVNHEKKEHTFYHLLYFINEFIRTAKWKDECAGSYENQTELYFS